jgi:Fe-S oxidoreductase
VATCPHCYNTLKNDYLQYGVHYQVLHHTEFIAELIQQGKLAFNGGDGKAVCYHDSCYLGRYNNVYKSPREVLQSIPGTKLLEMERARHRSFCCGAGGGRMWMEEHLGKRINEMRVEQALEVNPEVIASACPYCLTMLEDGIKAKGKEELIKTLDVAEIIEKSLRSV